MYHKFKTRTLENKCTKFCIYHLIFCYFMVIALCIAPIQNKCYIHCVCFSLFLRELVH